ncbi:MAG: amidase family protein, partial [Polymorphobacter sp.]
GSSGGSGAAVAAGLCDAALGTDTMGSIRVPAAYCGIYGFKPANTAVSQDGLELCEASLDVIGPLARSLDTLVAVARVMSDFGAGSSAAAPALLAGSGGVDCSDAVVAALAQAADALAATASVTLPVALARVRFAGFVLTARSLAAALADADPALLSPQLKRLIGYGPARAPADWAADQTVLRATAAALQSAVTIHGALLLPTCPGPAFTHASAAPVSQADFTCIANIAGLPAISIPGGRDDGLPIGLQLIGQTGHEAALFAMARRLDAALAAYRPPVPFGF